MSRCLLVTRPQPQAEQWVQSLVAEGLTAAALPLMAIAPLADGTSLGHTWADLPRCAFVMFVSGNAVAQFFAAQPAGTPWPQGLRAGATGPGTASALRAVGLPETQIVMPAANEAQTWDAEALWQRIADWPWASRHVLLVRGEAGRDWLAERWRAAGATVHAVAAYRRVLPTWSLDESQRLHMALAQPQQHAWLFSSSEAARNLDLLRAQATPNGAPSAATVWHTSLGLATHPRIAQTARELGFGRVLTVAPGLESVASALRGLNREPPACTEGGQGPSLQSAPPS